jgi:hypothetical protein
LQQCCHLFGLLNDRQVGYHDFHHLNQPNLDPASLRKRTYGTTDQPGLSLVGLPTNWLGCSNADDDQDEAYCLIFAPPVGQLTHSKLMHLKLRRGGAPPTANKNFTNLID